MKKTIVIAVVLIISIAFFYPKERVVGGPQGPLVGPNEVWQVEEYKCFGIARDISPEGVDDGGRALCYGVRHSKTCIDGRVVQAKDGSDLVEASPVSCD